MARVWSGVELLCVLAERSELLPYSTALLLCAKVLAACTDRKARSGDGIRSASRRGDDSLSFWFTRGRIQHNETEQGDEKAI